MNFGDMTFISSTTLAYSGNVASATFSPLVDSRYLILQLHAVGPVADSGDRNIITSLKDVKRETEYVLDGSATLNRGVALRDICAVNGYMSPHWAGDYEELRRTVTDFAPNAESVSHALRNIEKTFGAPGTDVAAIPMDGEFSIEVKAMAAADTPTHFVAVVMYVGSNVDGFGRNAPVFNRPFWLPYARQALATTAASGDTVKTRLPVPSERYGGETGFARHMGIRASLFAQSDYAIDSDSEMATRLSTNITGCRSIFEPRYAPLSLCARAFDPLPITTRALRYNDEVGYEIEHSTLGAAAYLHLSDQFLTERA